MRTCGGTSQYDVDDVFSPRAQQYNFIKITIYAKLSYICSCIVIVILSYSYSNTNSAKQFRTGVGQHLSSAMRCENSNVEFLKNEMMNLDIKLVHVAAKRLNDNSESNDITKFWKIGNVLQLGHQLVLLDWMDHHPVHSTT